ncbi:hypothetical protein CDD83_492 [Cordyceps sp. RAO-2017]|nr:hypothetical protein CDD83_492 [Cordyceps sp. RAO-2017]
MASVQDRKAPSAGTKVTGGKDAPVSREGAGLVASESLAAQSYREGGEFAENRRAEPENISSSNDTAGPQATSSQKASGHAVGSRGGTAPSYVVNQNLRDPHGPHGKNLKEGGFEDPKLEDGLQKAFNAEPGSIDDPGRVAEATFAQKEAAQSSASTQKDGQLSTGTAFDGLNPETSS